MLLMTSIQLRHLSESVWEEPSKPEKQQMPAQGMLVDRILAQGMGPCAHLAQGVVEGLAPLWLGVHL